LGHSCPYERIHRHYRFRTDITCGRLCGRSMCLFR
jgi:hypothetical protein